MTTKFTPFGGRGKEQETKPRPNIIEISPELFDLLKIYFFSAQHNDLFNRIKGEMLIARLENDDIEGIEKDV